MSLGGWIAPEFVDGGPRILPIEQQRFGGGQLDFRIVRMAIGRQREERRRLVPPSGFPFDLRLVVHRPASSNRSTSAGSPLRMPTPPAYA